MSQNVLTVQLCTHTWAKRLDVSRQGSDPIHRDIFFIAKVNVKDVSHFMVRSQSLYKASVPVLDTHTQKGGPSQNTANVNITNSNLRTCLRRPRLTISQENWTAQISPTQGTCVVTEELQYVFWSSVLMLCKDSSNSGLWGTRKNLLGL